MEIELSRSVEILPRSLNILIAPESIAADALRALLNPQRYLILYVCGNYSRLLSILNLREGDFEIRRAFTAAQLLTILEEAHQTLIFIEHDPNLFAESEELLGYAAMALKEISKESAVTIYSPFPDDSLRYFSNIADRFFYLGDFSQETRANRYGSRYGQHRKPQKDCASDLQRTLEVF